MPNREGAESGQKCACAAMHGTTSRAAVDTPAQFSKLSKDESPGQMSVRACGRFLWLRGLDLNQRPLGYEPNELPDCSTPRMHSTQSPPECQGILRPPPRRQESQGSLLGLRTHNASNS